MLHCKDKNVKLYHQLLPLYNLHWRGQVFILNADIRFPKNKILLKNLSILLALQNSHANIAWNCSVYFDLSSS